MFDQPMKRVLGSTLMAGLMALGLGACEDATGPDGARTTVTLSQLQEGSASMAASMLASETGLAQVTMEEVTSIVVRVTRVQVHRAGGDDGNGDGNGNGDGAGGPAWVDLAVESTEVDLIADLSDGQTVTLADGELDAGSYDQVRLFVDSAAIVFSEAQPVPGGGDETVTEAQLEIPSAAQTGIKIPGASFTVEEESPATVEILFDAGTSVQNINITGTGQVMMAPVLIGENASESG